MQRRIFASHAPLDENGRFAEEYRRPGDTPVG